MRYIIVGDVHGDLNQLLYPLIEYFKSPLDTRIIYLGDYFDRGDSDVYIYEILKLILDRKKEKRPNFQNIILLRGNHECYDDGTPDIPGYLANNARGCIVSFIASSAMHNLELPLFYYDKDMNVLFSHSAYSGRSLQSILNEEQKFFDDFSYGATMTFTSDRPLDVLPDFGFYNVHGHDHKASSETRIKKFFSNNKGDITMISLDNDASYGFRTFGNIALLISNEYDDDEYDDEVNIPYTDLFYATFDFDGYNYRDVDVVNKEIQLTSEEDLNSISLEVLAEMLSKYDDNFSWLSCDSSYDIFKSVYRNVMKEIPIKCPGMENICNSIPFLFKDLYDEEMPMWGTDRRRIYFHNVPYEFYQKLGYDEEYKPPWVLFWSVIGSLRNYDKDDVVMKVYGMIDNFNVYTPDNVLTNNDLHEIDEFRRRKYGEDTAMKINGFFNPLVEFTIILVLICLTVVVIVVLFVQKISLNNIVHLNDHSVK